MGNPEMFSTDWVVSLRIGQNYRSVTVHNDTPISWGTALLTALNKITIRPGELLKLIETAGISPLPPPEE